MTDPRAHLRELILEYGSHRVFYRLGRSHHLPPTELDRLLDCVQRASHDIENELDRLGVPRG